MERYSLIVVTDETSPIRRFDIRKDLVQRAIWGAAIAVVLLLVGGVDYVRIRADQDELQQLRAANAEQRERIDQFGETLSEVEANLVRLQSFERKVRIIANLPGSVATGGEDVTAVGSATTGDLEATAEGGQTLAAPGETNGADPLPAEEGDKAERHSAAGGIGGDEASFADRVSILQRDAQRLGRIAGKRELSLAKLLDGLEGKRRHLASTPAIWPTKGWLTSRFGNRVSPFTGARQFHGGIDIAGARGTDVIAPARGKVSFAGKRGPLGRSVTIEHGYGIRTTYGHNDELFVKRGQEIERGQVIASLGSTGRSTGPHLHYVVEVSGKAVNPLNYIFD
ncbi:MAG: M23 family metallopeptidase [Deltaproteobacteria bacterium]|nr:M23 family metallopeptidase [Deltaproteobacteria bacterium]